GYAVDNFLVQDPLGRPFGEENQLQRIEQSIADVLASGRQLVPRLAQRPLPRRGAGAFDVRPFVAFDNEASHRFTVIEVAARDRPALLNRLARALFEQHAMIRSAHVTAFGERVADTFYVTDLTGEKIVDEARMATIRKALIEASSDEMQAELEPA
ncbi:MAG: bifunctional uridylyltransferase/uridylyl-removing protein, partial [Alphaproteobacteria bacterium]|nr:bifunctional uridylyltransferase/uridylyl-removing protein [Alphaproteobacteria bacterium]